VIEALDVLGQSQPNRAVLDLFIQVKILSLLGYVDEAAIPISLQNRSISDIIMAASPATVAQLEVLVAKATESSHL